MQTSTTLVLLSALAASAAHTASAFQYGSGNRVMWENDCDFYGSDLYSVQAIPDACGDICADNAACSHWSWSNHNGGTCWLKSGSGTAKKQAWGVGCGYVIGRFSDNTQQQGGSTNNGLSVVDTQAMLNSINAYRAQNGRAPLTTDTRLTRAALGHTQEQASRCYMTHDGANGSDLGDRITASGYEWASVRENVAAGQQSVSDVMTSWWNSPGHRENLLASELTNVGFAKAVNSNCGNYKIYWTQDFGKSA